MPPPQGLERTLKVLHVAPTFFPAVYWGGTIHCNLALCDALVGLSNVTVSVLTTDSAGPRRNERLAESGREITFSAGYKVYYARRRFGVSISFELLRKLWPMIKSADIVHLTSAYSFPTIPTIVACRLLKKPLVWSPHGALQRWHGSRRPVLKRLWEAVCDRLLEPTRTVLHVTSVEEAEESHSRIHRADVEVVGNGVGVPQSLLPRVWCPKGTLRLVFIGRLDPKKGIENLLRAMTRLDVSVTLAVCGSGDAGYAASLEKLAEDLGVTDRVVFRGHVDEVARSVAFSEADICVVPSHTENFGMVVVEALAHGVPVIASRGTPWQGIEQHQCGRWVDNTPESLADAIEAMHGCDLDAMGARGRAWMQRSFSWPVVAARIADVYERLVSVGSRRKPG